MTDTNEPPTWFIVVATLTSLAILIFLGAVVWRALGAVLG